MTIEEQHKDNSTEQLINAISNTLVALDRQSHRVNALNHQMAEYQQSMQKDFLEKQNGFIKRTLTVSEDST